MSRKAKDLGRWQARDAGSRPFHDVKPRRYRQFLIGRPLLLKLLERDFVGTAPSAWK
jgi:hypothetical protein